MLNSDKKNIFSFIIILIFIAGVFVRYLKGFVYIDVFTQDEALRYLITKYTSNLGILDLTSDSPRLTTISPVYFVVNKIFTYGTESFLSIRFRAFMISFFTLLTFAGYLIKYFSKESEQVKLLALSVFTFFSLSNFFILYGSLFREYNIVIALVLFSLMLIHNIVINRSNLWPKCILLTFLLILSLVFSYSSIWFFSSLFFLLMFTWKDQRFQQVRYSYLASLILSTPLYIYFYFLFKYALAQQVHQTPLDSWFSFMFPILPFLGVDFGAAGFFGLESESILKLSGIILVSILCLLSLNFYKKRSVLSFYFLSSSVIPLSFLIIFSYAIKPIIDNKNLWFPLFLIVIGGLYLIVQLKNKNLRWILLSCLLGAMVWNLRVNLKGYINSIPPVSKRTYENILEDISSDEIKNGSYVFQNGRDLDPLYFYHYWKYGELFPYFNTSVMRNGEVFGYTMTNNIIHKMNHASDDFMKRSIFFVSLYNHENLEKMRNSLFQDGECSVINKISEDKPYQLYKCRKDTLQ